VTPAELQAALDAATETLATGGFPEAEDHARDVLALVACVSALRDDEGHGPNPCGAHGCTLAPNDGGQRVNGGCRCSAAALRLAYLAMRRERDAYRKAKQENDERFMIERDTARAERDEARARIARYVAAVDEREAASDGQYAACDYASWLNRDARVEAAYAELDAALDALRGEVRGE